MADSSHPWKPDYSVLGISLFGPPPLGTVHLEWSSHLAVLYGMNGVGKTVLLKAIGSLLRGRMLPGCQAFLHVRVHGASESIDWRIEGLAAELVLDVTEHIKRRWMEPGQTDEFIERVDAIDRLRDVEKGEVLSELVAASVAEGKGSIAGELGTQGLFSFEAVGEGEARWLVYAAAFPSESTPAIRHYLSKYSSKAQEVHASVDLSRTASSRSQGGMTEWTHGLFAGPLPAFVPVPLVWLGEFRNAWILPHPIEAQISTAEHGILDYRFLEDFLSDPYEPGEDGWTRVRPDVWGTLEDVAVAATLRLAELIPAAPRIVTHRPADGTLPGFDDLWRAEDPWSGAVVPLDRLSQGQQRWALIALQEQLTGPLRFERYRAILIDEPEEALHSAAVANLARSLAAQAGTESDGPIIVTSHSAAFLSAADARLYHVARDSLGSAVLNELLPTSGDSIDAIAERLGITRGELLQLYRTFLIVEGAHDVAVIEGMIGVDLEQARVKVVPNRGARRVMSIAEGEVIMDFTDARILVVVDNTRTAIPEAFERAKRIAVSGSIEAAIREITIAGEGQRTQEEKLVYSLAHRALRTGSADRLMIHGLAHSDIIELLPVERLVRGEPSWEDLRKRYESTAPPELSFKAWLKQEFGADLRTGRLKSIAEEASQDGYPPDIVRILDLCTRGTTTV